MRFTRQGTEFIRLPAKRLLAKSIEVLEVGKMKRAFRPVTFFLPGAAWNACVPGHNHFTPRKKQKHAQRTFGYVNNFTVSHVSLWTKGLIGMRQMN
jgi:hypothetical protein